MRVWHVLFTKPKRERQVQAQLEQAGIETYLPLLPRCRLGIGVPKPLFPRYLFAQLVEANVHPAEIRWTRGLTDLVRIGDEYATVDEAVLDHIRARLHSLRNRKAPFRSGQRVRLPEGHPLADLEVLFEKPLSDGARAQVLIKLLGRLVRAEVDMVDLSPEGSTAL